MKAKGLFCGQRCIELQLIEKASEAFHARQTYADQTSGGVKLGGNDRHLNTDILAHPQKIMSSCLNSTVCLQGLGFDTHRVLAVFAMTDLHMVHDTPTRSRTSGKMLEPRLRGNSFTWLVNSISCDSCAHSIL